MTNTFQFNEPENAALFVEAVLRSEEGSALIQTIQRKPQGVYSVTLATENLDGITPHPGCEKQPTTSITRPFKRNKSQGSGGTGGF